MPAAYMDPATGQLVYMADPNAMAMQQYGQQYGQQAANGYGQQAVAYGQQAAADPAAAAQAGGRFLVVFLVIIWRVEGCFEALVGGFSNSLKSFAILFLILLKEEEVNRDVETLSYALFVSWKTVTPFVFVRTVS